MLRLQSKQEQLAAVAVLAAYLKAEPNTPAEANFELVQSLGALFPPAPCDVDVIEEASGVFGSVVCGWCAADHRQGRWCSGGWAACARSSTWPPAPSAPSSTLSTVA